MKKIRYLTGLLSRPQRRSFAWFVLLYLLNPIADLFSVSMILPVFQQAFSDSVPTSLVLKVLFLSVMLFLVGVLELLRSRAAAALTADISQDWSVKIYELYCMEELREHNKKTPMQAINGVRNDTSICASLLITFVGLLVDALTLTAYSVVLIFVARAAGAVSSLAVAAMVLLLYMGKRIHMAQYGEKKRHLEIRTGGMVSTAFGSYKEVKIDSRRGNMLEKYRRASEECAGIQKDYAFMTSWQGILLQHIMQAGLFFTLAVLLIAKIPLPAILPQTMAYIALLLRMIPEAKKIVSSLTAMQYGTKYFEAFREDMER